MAQSDFLTSAQYRSNRDNFVVYVGNELFGVKWRDWKVMFKEVSLDRREIVNYATPRLFNLIVDPKEDHSDVYRGQNFWVLKPVAAILDAHRQSLREHPPVAPGTPDPASPAAPGAA